MSIENGTVQHCKCERPGCGHEWDSFRRGEQAPAVTQGMFPDLLSGLLSGLLQLAVIVFCVGGWATHLYVCFTGNRWGFFLAGAIVFPIGIIHGLGIWFGFWN